MEGDKVLTRKEFLEMRAELLQERLTRIQAQGEILKQMFSQAEAEFAEVRKELETIAPPEPMKES